MKDNRYIKADSSVSSHLDLSAFPNFHESGNIQGMRDRYYGKDAFLVHSQGYIYHVDEDTFEAVKDINYLAAQPKWLVNAAKDLTAADRQSYAAHLARQGEGGRHEKAVASLAMVSDMAHRIADRMQQGITDIVFNNRRTDGRLTVKFRLDGQWQPAFPLSREETAQVANRPLAESRQAAREFIAKRNLQSLLGIEHPRSLSR